MRSLLLLFLFLVLTPLSSLRFLVPLALGKTFSTAPQVLIGVMATPLPSLALDSTTLVSSSAHGKD